MTAWSPGIEESDVLLAADGRPSTRGLAQVLRRHRATRLWRAIRAWVACWLIAGGSFLLPIRVVAVPLFLVAGPLAAANAWAERATLLRVRGACPLCGELRDHRVAERARQVIPIRCDACGGEILVSPGSGLLGLPDEG